MVDPNSQSTSSDARTIMDDAIDCFGPAAFWISAGFWCFERHAFGCSLCWLGRIFGRAFKYRNEWLAIKQLDNIIISDIFSFDAGNTLIYYKTWINDASLTQRHDGEIRFLLFGNFDSINFNNWHVEHWPWAMACLRSQTYDAMTCWIRSINKS